MKRIVTITIVLVLLFLSLIVIFLPVPYATSDDETALIDSKGEYVAYITGEGIIYVWEGGTPPAYLEGESIYSFNGKHLGWLLKGYIVDHNGYKVGAVEGVVKSSSLIEPFKGFKGFVPFKSFKEMAPRKPKILNKWSSIPLTLFLKTGVAAEKGELGSDIRSQKTLSFLQRYIKLKNILSDSEYRQCGLHKLTNAELANLEKTIVTITYAVNVTMQENTALFSDTTSIQNNTGTKHWIKSKSSDGSTITLEDGSVWQVDPINRIDTILWLPTENVLILDQNTLLNIDQKQKVSAKRIR